MPAPTNISWATATNLGSTLPVNGSQTVDFAGTTYTTYYTWTADADRVIGAWFFGDLTTYEPTVHLYTVVGGVATAYPPAAPTFGLNVPIQAQVTAGVTYGFQVVPNAGNPTPANLTWNLQAAPTGGIPAGSLLVNDDTAGFPGMTVNATTGLVNGFKTGMVAGEAGDITTDGTVIALEDNAGTPGNVALYSSALALITSVDPFPTSSSQIRLRRVYNAGAFYVGWAGSGGTNAQVVRVSSAGVIGATTYTLAALGLTAVAVDSAESVIYYSGSGGSLNSNIKRWNIGTNSAMTDLVADFGGTYFVSDMLMLGDDTLLVMYAQSSPNDVTIKRYNSTTGAVLNTYALGAEDNETSPKLATGTDDPTSFWAWTHNTDGTSKFRHITASDGTVQTTLTVQEFEDGTFHSAATATPTRFGISQSCPFVVLRSQVAIGSVTVTKNAGTDTTTSFPFTAGGGLSPASFSLTGGASQLFTNVPAGTYSVSETTQTGWLPAAYHVSNGTSQSAITVAAGDAVTVTVTNTAQPSGSDIRVSRRLRRFPLPFEANVYQFLSRLEILVQSGVGLATGQGSDPVIMCRISRDGGQTWGYELTMGLGKQGEYSYRAYLNRLGRGRNFVVELTTSDPVFVAILAAYADLETGTA